MKALRLKEDGTKQGWKRRSKWFGKMNNKVKLARQLVVDGLRMFGACPQSGEKKQQQSVEDDDDGEDDDGLEKYRECGTR